MRSEESIQGKHLHFDCVSGIAGDMTLGAMIDLGVPASVISDAIIAVGLGSDRLQVEAIVKSGISATNVTVRCDVESGGGHDHHHYSDIRKRISTSALSTSVTKLALAMFDRVAEAEASLHGTTTEEVAFHEVGAVDSIVDIIGSAAAIDWLRPASVSCSVVAMGRGKVGCAHGILPVPSPAALEIMRRAEALVADGDCDRELCTPTGAAIVATTVSTWGAMPAMIPLAIGYGAGDIELPDRPNVLRITVGARHQTPETGVGIESVVVLETNIDDMSPELCEHAAEALFAAGALDVWWSPITMKKGRPALSLRAMCLDAHKDEVMKAVVVETSAIGVRFERWQRWVLDRELLEVETEFGPVTLKIARLADAIVNVAPEYESCRECSRQHAVPLKAVFAAAIAAWHQRTD